MVSQEVKKKYDKILVIDDSEVDLYIARTLLEHSGVASEIVTRKSAPEALDYLKESIVFPDLILLDLVMDEMDASGFLAEFGRFPDKIKRNTRVILLTAYLDYKEGKVKETLETGMIAKCISKPLSLNKLVV